MNNMKYFLQKAKEDFDLEFRTNTIEVPTDDLKSLQEKKNGLAERRKEKKRSVVD